MDQSTALHKLLEAADLAKMIEELMAPGSLERLSPSGIAGARATLRNLRETMLACHDLMAGDLVARARSRYEGNMTSNAATSAENPAALQSRSDSPAIVRPPVMQDQPRMVKKDLRTTLSQMVERNAS